MEGQPNPILTSIHLQEYSILQARNTSLLTLQASAFGVIAVFAGLMAGAATRGLAGFTIAWTIFSVGAFVMMAWYQVSLEIYRNVSYIETALKPALQSASGGAEPFWTYESFRAGDIGPRHFWDEWAVFSGVTVSYMILVLVRAVSCLAWNWRFGWSDSGFVALGIIELGLLWRQAARLQRKRNEFLAINAK